jgi:hypothetical protein
MTARANFVTGSIAGLIVGAVLAFFALKPTTVSPFDDGIYVFGSGCELYAPVLTLNKDLHQQVSWRSVDSSPQTYTIHFTKTSPFSKTCNPSCTVKGPFNPGAPDQSAHGYYAYEILHDNAVCKADTDNNAVSGIFNDPGLNIKP